MGKNQNEPMRILMVLERDFPPDLRVENEIRSLINQGHEIWLACFTFGNQEISENWSGCVVKKKPIGKFIYKSSVGALKLPFYFSFWRKHINHIISEFKPDAIHVHDLPLAKIGIETKHRYGIRFTLDLHENWPAFLRTSKHANTLAGKVLSSNSQWEKYELSSCREADNIIVVIEEAKERIISLGIPSEKVTVVANYPELSDFSLIERKKNRSDDALSILYAGGIGEHRGLQYAIRALPDILKVYPMLKLKIFGEGNYRSELEKQCRELNLTDNVVFYGQVPYKRVLEELAQADFAIIPHVKSDHTDSTIPHKLFQYMYSSIPVLASNCKPIERIVKDNNVGLVYQYDSPDDFAMKFKDLLANRSLIAEQAKNGKKAVEKVFNWQSEQLKLGTLYSKT